MNEQLTEMEGIEMRDMLSPPLILTDNIFNDDPSMLTGNEIISCLYGNLPRRAKSVSTKDIILCLIRSIENAKGPLLYDIYLNALEFIVYRTPDDWER